MTARMMVVCDRCGREIPSSETYWRGCFVPMSEGRVVRGSRSKDRDFCKRCLVRLRLFDLVTLYVDGTELIARALAKRVGLAHPPKARRR